MAWVRFPAVVTSDLQASPLQREVYRLTHRCFLQDGFVAGEQNAVEGDEVVAAVAASVAVESAGD